MEKSKGVGLLAVMLVAALSVAACTAPASKTTEGAGNAAVKAPIKVGAVLSLTGSYAGLGAPEKNTLEMEVAAINAAGGVKGQQIELFIEDDATDPAKAQAATVKLIEQNKVVALIGATGTVQTMGMRRLSREATRTTNSQPQVAATANRNGTASTCGT